MPSEPIYIGTSGWSYAHWRDVFYPADIAASDMLPTYAKTFHTVELNNSFYTLPDPQRVSNWADITPQDFVFACTAWASSKRLCGFL